MRELDTVSYLHNTLRFFILIYTFTVATTLCCHKFACILSHIWWNHLAQWWSERGDIPLIWNTQLHRCTVAVVSGENSSVTFYSPSCFTPNFSINDTTSTPNQAQCKQIFDSCGRGEQVNKKLNLGLFLLYHMNS